MPHGNFVGYYGNAILLANILLALLIILIILLILLANYYWQITQDANN